MICRFPRSTWGRLGFQQQRQAMLSKPRFAANASVEQWLDVLSVQLDGFSAGRDETCVAHIRITDQRRAWRVNVSHGALD